MSITFRNLASYKIIQRDQELENHRKVVIPESIVLNAVDVVVIEVEAAEAVQQCCGLQLAYL